MKKIDVKNEKVKTQDALLVRSISIEFTLKQSSLFRMAWQKTSIVWTELKQAQSQKRVMVAAQFHDTYKKKAKVKEKTKSQF